jgi:2,4-dienoyl-CoA reductase-like NADH-dependent reductase (Old Yellow Enzyme family)
MSRPFEPFKINQLRIKNRFVRSATMDNMANNGMVTDAQVDLYRNLALGEVGLIISHGIAPSRIGRTGPGQLGAFADEHIKSLKRLTDVVHANGSKVAAQFLHAGWQSNPEFIGRAPVGPSDTVHPSKGTLIKGLSQDEVYQEIETIVQSGRRIVESGFDGIQLHGAHSWMISAFLSPATNKRQDDFGGSAEKRANFVVQIFKGLRQMAGPNYPIFIKLGLKDYHPEGKSLEEGLKIAQIFEKLGMDCIEISEGMEIDGGHHIRPGAITPYYLDECRAARQALKLPLILVGGFRQLKDIEQVLKEDITDAVSLCRPFVMDPYLVKKFREGTATQSDCISCGGCSGMKTTGLKCTQLNK